MNLTDQMLTCQKCSELSKQRVNVVIGEGAVPANCIFIGEGPGAKEDELGKPFVGRSGILLRSTIKRLGYRPEEYHILNCIKCRPPENRNPTEEELLNCRPYLIKQLKALKPKVLIALGRFAHAFVLGVPPDKIYVTENSGKLIQYTAGIDAMLTFHPSYVSRHPSDEVYFAFVKHLKQALKHARKS